MEATAPFPTPTPWVVLDLAGFRPGPWTNWAALAASYAQSRYKGCHLHYVACTACVPAAQSVPTGEDFPGATELRAGLALMQGDGVHRISLQPGRLELLLSVGALPASLRQLRLQADEIFLPAMAVDAALLGALARCCKRGTVVRGDGSAPLDPAVWQGAGFRCSSVAGEVAVYDPPWARKTSREPWRAWARPPGTCAVVGAGMAGAAVAASLARRGWQVRVLDAAAQPAAGASGLPVGLAAPYATADDSPLSRLTRHGVRHLMQQARQLLAVGQDWSPSGAHERDAAGALQWQPHACWIKPQALVRAWLSTPGVEFMGCASVQAVQRSGSAWALCDVQGRVLAQADRVVLAQAAGVTIVLDHSADLQAAGAGLGWPATHTVRGLVSWGHHTSPEQRPFPQVPVHGNGSLIAHVPFADGARWLVGASYQPVSEREAEWPDDKNHGANALRLEKLAPELFSALTPALEAGALQAWKGQRCVTADRMPLLGPVSPDAPDVWTCAGFGSRGLSLVAVCAELLAAQWAGEPWPLESGLAQGLLPYRKRR